jgi:hypothetical protein
MKPGLGVLVLVLVLVHVYSLCDLNIHSLPCSCCEVCGGIVYSPAERILLVSDR